MIAPTLLRSRALKAKLATLLFWLSVLAGYSCSRSGPRENSAVCGFTLLASANMVIQQANNIHRVMREPPADLSSRVAARVVGYGTSTARTEESDSSGLMFYYQGEGFPAIPGFGVALVDDSSEVFRGVLIYDLDVPRGYPRLGAIAGPELVIPLIGLRVMWSAVSDPTCPLFAAVDTASEGS